MGSVRDKAQALTYSIKECTLAVARLQLYWNPLMA